MLFMNINMILPMNVNMLLLMNKCITVRFAINFQPDQGFFENSGRYFLMSSVVAVSQLY